MKVLVLRLLSLSLHAVWTALFFQEITLSRTDPGVQPSLGRGFNMAQLENKGAETVLHRLGLEPTVF